jgi:hypothetical protein
MLEVRRAMRRERIFRDRTNPLEIYDDLDKLEKQKLNMEKNKLALVIWKLKYEMSLQGIDFKIPVLDK